MKEYKEIRIFQIIQGLSVYVRTDKWRHKTFPKKMSLYDIMARLKIGAEDHTMWPLRAPPHKNPKLATQIRKFRHMLFMTHFGGDHRPYYDAGQMQCHSCDIDFKRDTADQIEEKTMEHNHKRFKKSLGSV